MGNKPVIPLDDNPVPKIKYYKDATDEEIQTFKQCIVERVKWIQSENYDGFDFPSVLEHIRVHNQDKYLSGMPAHIVKETIIPALHGQYIIVYCSRIFFVKGNHNT